MDSRRLIKGGNKSEMYQKARLGSMGGVGEFSSVKNQTKGGQKVRS